MERVGGAIHQEDQLMNLIMKADRACCDTPVSTLAIKRGWSTGQEESQARKRMMEPNQCPVTSEEVEGTIMDTRIDIPDRCRDSNLQTKTGHNSVMTKDKYTEPMTGRTDPVMIESAQLEGSAVLLQPELFFRNYGSPDTGGVFEIGYGSQEQ